MIENKDMFEVAINKWELLSKQIRVQEYKQGLQQIDLDIARIELKREAMAEGLKSTEAKEYARTKTIDEEKRLLEMEHELNILKDERRKIEYELRYYFQQYSDLPADVDTLSVEVMKLKEMVDNGG